MPDVDLPAPQAARLQRLDRLAFLLDDAFRIPVLGYRVGWDAVIGLVPGLGDAAGLMLSAYLVFEAARFGLPLPTLLRMAFNVAVEALVGLIPLLGDVFDATWKANARNLALLHAHLGAAPARHRRADRRFMVIVLAGMALLVVLLVVLAVVVAVAVVGLFGA